MKILGIPGINGLGYTKGSEKSPQIIFESLKKIFSKENMTPLNFENEKIIELMYDSMDPEKSNDNLYNDSIKFLKKDEKPIFIGGDHSISYALVRAFFDNSEINGKIPCLIVFDAHPDLMEPVSRKFPTHEEWLRAIIEDGFPVENILLVGSRNAEYNEIEYLKNKKIKTISMNRFLENFEDTVDVITEFSNGRDLYVSIDLDCIDPVFAPGTYYQEPGGFTSREFIYIIQRISKIKTLKAVDLVELNPDLDKNNVTAKLAAKIVAELN